MFHVAYHAHDFIEVIMALQAVSQRIFIGKEFFLKRLIDHRDKNAVLAIVQRKPTTFKKPDSHRGKIAWAYGAVVGVEQQLRIWWTAFNIKGRSTARAGKRQVIRRAHRFHSGQRGQPLGNAFIQLAFLRRSKFSRRYAKAEG